MPNMNKKLWWEIDFHKLHGWQSRPSVLSSHCPLKILLYQERGLLSTS
jgi:hypothetical protein